MDRQRIATASAGEGRLQVQATAILPDQDLIVAVLGGDRSHIGAVAIGIPRPSLRHPEQRSASSSVFTITGHQEDALAKTWAEDLARRLGWVTVVVAGLHIDDPAPGDLEALQDNAARAVELLAERLQELLAR